jgi:hypothetical protein
MEGLEARPGHGIQETGAGIGEPLLPEIDEQILNFVKSSGKATAEQVRAKFSYKGKNAACARLNRLCDMNLLLKKQAGRKVYFLPI